MTVAETRSAAAALIAVLALSACGTGAATALRGRAAEPAPRCRAKRMREIPRSGWAAARRQLAPAGATSIRLCRYSGLDARPPEALVASALVTDRSLVSGLVRRLDALPPLPRRAFACPNDVGSQITAFLAYPSLRRVTIVLATSGCLVVTNGDVERIANGFGPDPLVGPRLLAELIRLTPLSGG